MTPPSKKSILETNNHMSTSASEKIKQKTYWSTSGPLL
jgi:hypothetical protein